LKELEDDAQVFTAPDGFSFSLIVCTDWPVTRPALAGVVDTGDR
jgi:hypothetical protein